MNYLLDKDILNICNYEYDYFLNKTNVVGIGLGYKIINGVNTNEKCINVFVEKKCEKNCLNSNDLIPKCFNGISTDVIEIGILKPLTLTNRVRPVMGGYCIGSAFFPNISGTYGCMVTNGNNYFILSNNHVLAGENQVPKNTPILQPSLDYGGTSPNDIITQLYNFIPLEFISPGITPENFVDCAIGIIKNTSLVSSSLYRLGIPSGVTEGFLGKAVKKVGFFSELTFGNITAIGATMRTAYDTGLILFKDQIISTPMAESGDSGSILLDGDKKVVGLVCCGNITTTMSNPIINVLSALNVKLVTSSI